MADIRLYVNNKIFSGWTEVSVRTSLEQVSGMFELGFTELFPGQTEKWAIRLGDYCEVRIHDTIVIKGYIDDIDITYDEESHSLRVSGRDATGDLVDCSHVSPPSQWKERTIDKIFADLCEPFGISVVSTEPLPKSNEDFVHNEGDTIFESISKLCKKYALLPISLGDGKLTLTRTGSTQAGVSLVLGQNILSANFQQSNKDRYNKYIVKGQGRGFDTKLLEDVSEPLGESLDETIPRYRPLIIISETQGDNSSLQDRAKWESTTRAGRSRKYICMVNGWLKKKGGQIWSINELIKINDSLAGIDDKWLISGLKMSLNNDGGEMTEITAVPPVAFEQIVDDSKTESAAAKWEAISQKILDTPL